MGLFQNIISGGTGSLIKTVGETIDQFTTTKEEKMQHELEMTKAEMQYQTEMARISLEEKKAAYQDTDSARKHDTEIQSSAYSTKLSKNTGSLLALGTTLLAFFLFIVVIFYNKIFKETPLDPNTKDIIIYILGVLSAIVTQIFSFYFGSSQGSADKNDLMKHLYSKNEAAKG
jgi:uncharacterized membrane protein (DUF485 family)